MTFFAVKAPESTAIDVYFESYVQKALETILVRRPISGLGNESFRTRFTVLDVGSWDVTVFDGSEFIIEREMSNWPDLLVEFDERSFRASQMELPRELEIFRMIYGNPQRFSRLGRMTGAIHVHLKHGREKYTGRIVFNNKETPQVTAHMDYHHFCDMLEHTVSGKMLFLKGKVKVRGNLPLMWKAEAVI